MHVKSLATKFALQAGMGAGEYQGQFANMRALMYIIGPLINSQLYLRLAGNPSFCANMWEEPVFCARRPHQRILCWPDY